MNKPTYFTDYAIPTGEHLKEIVEWFAADALGLTVTDYDKLMTGELPVTDELAKKIAAYTATRKDFWITLEKNYRNDLKRINGDKNE